ncbi:hypothetical protein Pmani_007289 [Petrolisthes manimaculis]|uniref:Uncharacterized protein n=1 Tax=Petrolisthes manimaculis TaxID=1843537 RepID=A0AAE1Q8P7_9EUCA|nr:hypothetical protein Pmani_007289 [Petrolisthes manimaculis]
MKQNGERRELTKVEWRNGRDDGRVEMEIGSVGGGWREGMMGDKGEVLSEMEWRGMKMGRGCGSVHHHQYTRPSLAWSGGGWTFITARLLHEVSTPRNVYTTTLTEARRG